MPDKETKRRAAKDKRRGKAKSTQAGEFVREEIHHVREGKHGARSTKQAIAIGLSKARRAGVKLPPPKRAKATTKQSARYASRAARRRTRPSPARDPPHRARHCRVRRRQPRAGDRRRPAARLPGRLHARVSAARQPEG
jgi:hypothetical protein